jgi:predicted RND superfamily exporter protein
MGVASLVTRFPTILVVFMVISWGLATILVIRFLPDYIDYDFSKLKQKSKQGQAVFQIYRRVTALFDLHQSPAVIIADDPSEVKEICQVVMAKKAAAGSGYTPLDTCKNIYSFLPEQQEEKLAVIAEIRKLLADKTIKLIAKEQRLEIDKLKEDLPSQAITLANLPEQITKNFEEMDGTKGRLVYVYPKKDARLWDGRNLAAYAEAVRETHLKSGRIVYSACEHVIYTDMLRSISADGPKTTIAAFLGVLFIIIINMKGFRPAAHIIWTLLIGIIWLGGIMAFYKIRLNFFNFIAIPTTFGIGVDYAVNIYQRYTLEGRGNVRQVILTTGGAVALCSLTTIFGYYTLVIAETRALVSFGTIALIGEFTCLGAALFMMPAIILILEKYKVNRLLPAPPSSGSNDEIKPA